MTVDEICILYTDLARTMYRESDGDWAEVLYWISDNIPNGYTWIYEENSTLFYNSGVYRWYMEWDEQPCERNEIRMKALYPKPFIKVTIFKK